MRSLVTFNRMTLLCTSAFVALLAIDAKAQPTGKQASEIKDVIQARYHEFCINPLAEKSEYLSDIGNRKQKDQVVKMKDMLKMLDEVQKMAGKPQEDHKKTLTKEYCKNNNSTITVDIESAKISSTKARVTFSGDGAPKTTDMVIIGGVWKIDGPMPQ